MKESYVQVYTGDGKGKTTAAMGLAVRALGRGKSVKIVQFLKGRETGEMLVLGNLEGAQFFQVSSCTKFFPNMTKEEKRQIEQEAQQFLKKIYEWLGKIDLLILDEALGAVSVGILCVEDICAILDNRLSTEIILTGRDAPSEIIARADLVTEMRAVKHYYDSGVKARKGIEY